VLRRVVRRWRRTWVSCEVNAVFSALVVRWLRRCAARCRWVALRAAESLRGVPCSAGVPPRPGQDPPATRGRTGYRTARALGACAYTPPSRLWRAPTSSEGPWAGFPVQAQLRVTAVTFAAPRGAWVASRPRRHLAHQPYHASPPQHAPYSPVFGANLSLRIANLIGMAYC
jgi:hypothetical protein